MDTKNHSLEIMLESTLEKQCGVRAGMRVLAAISGGADSVALLLLLCRVRARMGITVLAAHLDHQLRGEAAREDARFVRALCERLGVECVTGTADVRALAQVRKKGVEEAAREARYAFLHAQADALGADVIALAHHRNDQAETLLLHAVRGCDIRGLGAMRYRSGRLIRPLLDVEKTLLQAYLAQQGQAFCVDQTNFVPEEAERNRVRLSVMPTLRQINPGVDAALSRLARSAQRDEAYFEAQLAQQPLNPWVRMPYGGFFEIGALEKLPEALLSRALARYLAGADVQPSSLDIEKAMALVESGVGKAEITGSVLLVRAKRRMHIVTTANIPPREGVPILLHGCTRCGDWTVAAREALPGERGDGVHTQVLDAALLKGAQLRSYKPGDCFTPLGMNGTQKLKKTFQDAGVEELLRPYVPLIAADSQVLWLIGARPAQTAAVKESTRQAVHLTFTGEMPFDMRKK